MEDINNKQESRTASRNHIFNIIFEIEFIGYNNIIDVIEDYYHTLDEEVKVELKEDETFVPYIVNKELINKYVPHIVDKLDEIDEIISQNTVGWEIQRISKVDLAILRVSIYEILFEEDVPNKVAINEAINLAKEYGEDKSYSFVNAILAKV